MIISACRNDEKNGITNSIEVEYNAGDEAECREASMKLGPFMPWIMPLPEVKGGRELGESDVDFGMRIVRRLFDIMGSRNTGTVLAELKSRSETARKNGDGSLANLLDDAYSIINALR